MILSSTGNPHLTYCTNIHSGESWAEVRANLEQFTLGVKKSLAPNSRFGIGLRLSAAAAETLEDPATFSEFQDFLLRHDLYVFTINGFPYGTFHGCRVKEEVYLPDWLDNQRLTYTNRLARLLSRLLPEDIGTYGSISSVPGAFRERVRSKDDLTRIAENLISHATLLHQIHQESGKVIVLALEPEPCCIFETISEMKDFFVRYLLTNQAVADFSRKTGLTREEAEESIRRHLTVCLDACHGAVEFEEPQEAIATLRDAGIRVGKIQLSTGIRVPTLTPHALFELQRFADDVYLHQVVERRSKTLRRFVDLPAALADATADSAAEWRIHFHVPVFLSSFGPFENTQNFLSRVLEMQAAETISTHLEVETYTWDLLPEEYRTTDVVSAVARELTWVKERLSL